MKDIIVLLGYTSVGKSSIMNSLVSNRGFSPIVSSTTRPMRINEEEGKDYFFISEEEFFKRMDAGKFIETRSYNTIQDGKPAVWYYGIEWDAIKNGKRNVAILDYGGYQDFKKVFGNRIVSFFLTADKETIKERFLNRGDDSKEFERRLKDDERIFTVEVLENIDEILYSTSVEENVEEIVNIIRWYEFEEM